MSRLTEQLKMLRSEPALKASPEFVRVNRANLLAQIKNTVPAERPSLRFENVWSWLAVYMPKNTVYNLVRPVAVLVIVALVGTSGAIAAVDASYEALPGDFLYPAARLTQKTQVAVATLIGGENAAAKIHAKVAQALAVKTQKIIKIDDDKKAERLVIAVADLKSEISNISQNLDQTAGNTPAVNPSTAKDVKANTDQISSVLQSVKNDLLTSTDPSDKALSQDLTDAKNLAKDVGVKAVAVLVQHASNADVSSSTLADVKAVLISSAQTVANEAGQTKDSVNDAKIILDAVKSEVKDMAGASVSTSTTSTSAVTPEIVKKIDSVSNQTVAAVIKTDAAANEATQKANEVQALVTSGNLSGAVDKLKEATAANKVGDTISNAAIVNVQTVVPVVSVIKSDQLSSLLPEVNTSPSTTPTSGTSTVKITTTTIKTITITTTTTTVKTETTTTSSVKK